MNANILIFIPNLFTNFFIIHEALSCFVLFFFFIGIFPGWQKKSIEKFDRQLTVLTLHQSSGSAIMKQ